MCPPLNLKFGILGLGGSHRHFCCNPKYRQIPQKKSITVYSDVCARNYNAVYDLGNVQLGASILNVAGSKPRLYHVVKYDT